MHPACRVCRCDDPQKARGWRSVVPQTLIPRHPTLPLFDQTVTEQANQRVTYEYAICFRRNHYFLVGNCQKARDQ